MPWWIEERESEEVVRVLYVIQYEQRRQEIFELP